MEKTPKELKRNNTNIVKIYEYARNNGLDNTIYVKKDKHHKVSKVWFKKDKVYKYFSITDEKKLVNRTFYNQRNKYPNNPRFKTLYFIEKKFYHLKLRLHIKESPNKEYIQKKLLINRLKLDNLLA